MDDGYPVFDLKALLYEEFPMGVCCQHLTFCHLSTYKNAWDSQLGLQVGRRLYFRTYPIHQFLLDCSYPAVYIEQDLALLETWIVRVHSSRLMYKIYM